jgi:hypothetical protein
MDYLYTRWLRLKRHLGTAHEGLEYQQTWEAYRIATAPNHIHYKFMGFRKNSIVPNRLAERAHRVNLDLFIFFNTQEKQHLLFKRSSSVIERFIYKYLYPP